MDAVATDLDRRRLAQRHMPLVKSLALKLRDQIPPQLELDDLINYGAKGLMEAAERFDATRGLAFSTFAYYRVRGAIYDGLRESGHVPRLVYRHIRTAEHVDDYLENAAAQQEGATAEARGRESTADTLQALSDHVSAVTTVFVTSMDADNARQISDDKAQDAFDRLDTTGFEPHLKKALERLNERERRIIQLCYYEDMTLKDAGATMGLSKSWASRVHARAIRKLQRFMAARDVTVPAPDHPG